MKMISSYGDASDESYSYARRVGAPAAFVALDSVKREIENISTEFENFGRLIRDGIKYEEDAEWVMELFSRGPKVAECYQRLRHYNAEISEYERRNRE